MSFLNLGPDFLPCWPVIAAVDVHVTVEVAVSCRDCIQ